MSYNTNNINDTPYEWADPEDQEVRDGAWGIARESPINILRDMDLMGAIAFIQNHGQKISAKDVVGAWFGSYRDRGRVFSFDLVVDPDHQRRGLGWKLFLDSVSHRGEEVETINLTIHHPAVAKIAQTFNFQNIEGSIWELDMRERIQSTEKS